MRWEGPLPPQAFGCQPSCYMRHYRTDIDVTFERVDAQCLHASWWRLCSLWHRPSLAYVV